jgi:hypothetical protein
MAASLICEVMARAVRANDLHRRLAKELDALKQDGELKVPKRDRLEFLDDSLAALQARNDREASVAWVEVRD